MEAIHAHIAAFCHAARRKRGTAAIEFAIAMPVMLLAMGWLYDFSNLLRARIQLSNAVGNAAQYAILAGKGVSAANLQAIVTKTSQLNTATATITGPACYCVSYSPTRLTSATCSSTCSNGAAAGTYVIVTGNYTYTPILPGLSHMVATSLSETTSVMVQ